MFEAQVYWRHEGAGERAVHGSAAWRQLIRRARGTGEVVTAVAVEDTLRHGHAGRWVSATFTAHRVRPTNEPDPSDRIG